MNNEMDLFSAVVFRRIYIRYNIPIIRILQHNLIFVITEFSQYWTLLCSLDLISEGKKMF